VVGALGDAKPPMCFFEEKDFFSAKRGLCAQGPSCMGIKSKKEAIQSDCLIS